MAHRPSAVQQYYNRFASTMKSAEVQHEGFLLKMGTVHKSFKVRYFVLYKNRTLAYWLNPTAEIYGKDPLHVIKMSEVRSIKIVNKPPKQRRAWLSGSSTSLSSDQDNEHNTAAEDEIGDDVEIDFEKTRYFCLELVTRHRTFLLCWDEAQAFNAWIRQLNHAVFGRSVYKAWFTKLGAKTKSWKRRWFVVFDTLEMRYYEQQDGTRPKGSIQLAGLTQITLHSSGDKYPKHRHILELMTPDRVWALAADSRAQQQACFGHICALLETHGPLKWWRLHPVFGNNCAIFEPTTNAFVQCFVALTPRHLYVFKSATECERAKECAFCDHAKHNIHLSRFVRSIVPLKSPVFRVCSAQQCQSLNRTHVFEVDTSYAVVRFAANHSTELEEWRKAWLSLPQLELEAPKLSVIQKTRSTPQPSATATATSTATAAKATKSASEKKFKHVRLTSKAQHPISNSLSLLKVAGRERHGHRTSSWRQNNQTLHEDSETDMAMDVQPMKRSKTERVMTTAAALDRKRSRSVTDMDLHARMDSSDDEDDKNALPPSRKLSLPDMDPWNDSLQGASLEVHQFGTYNPNTFATSYNPKKQANFMPNAMGSGGAGAGAGDSVPFARLDSIASAQSETDSDDANMDANLAMNLLSPSAHHHQHAHHSRSRNQSMLISETPARHASFDVADDDDDMVSSMATSLATQFNAGTRIRDASILNYSNANTMGYNNLDISRLPSVPSGPSGSSSAASSIDDSRIGHQNAHQLDNMQSMLSLGLQPNDEQIDEQKEQEPPQPQTSVVEETDANDTAFEFQTRDAESAARPATTLSDDDRVRIEAITQPGLRGDAYFEHSCFEQAIVAYTAALNAIDFDAEMHHASAYKYYCHRSECHRKTDDLKRAKLDTEAWMRIVWHLPNFEYATGCDIGSRVLIELRDYEQAKKLLIRTFQIQTVMDNRSGSQLYFELQKRLRTLKTVQKQYLATMTQDMDSVHLELETRDDTNDEDDAVRLTPKHDADEVLRKSKTARANTVLSDWLPLVEHKSAVALEREAKRLSCTGADIQQCPCVQRVCLILAFYSNTWCKTQETASVLDRISIYDIVHYLACYSLTQLLNDYVHIKEAHVDSLRQSRYEVFDYFVNTLHAECEDHLETCKCFLRMQRNQRTVDAHEDVFTKMYFNFCARTEIRDIGAMQILDSLHCYCLHSAQIVMMKLPLQIQNTDAPQSQILDAFLKGPQNAFTALDPQWSALYPFKTDIVDHEDAKNEHTNENDGEQKNGDRDDDDQKQQQPEYVLKRKHLQIGHPMISPKLNSDKNRRISPKYKTLKRELLQNEIYRLTELEWRRCLFRARVLKNTYKGKQWTAKDIGDAEEHTQYGVPPGLPIPTAHVMVLLLYTNNLVLQNAFKQRVFTAITRDRDREKFSTLKRRHREIAHFSQILYQTLKFFAYNTPLFLSSAVFYHAVNTKTLLGEFEFTVHAPTLITLEPSSAMMVCCDSRHSIFQFRAQENRGVHEYNLLDVSWLSDAPFHNAYLTMDCAFDVLDVIDDAYDSHEEFVDTLVLFKRLVCGHFIEDLLHPQQIHQHILLGLMSNMSEGYAAHSNIPHFMQMWFEHLVKQVDAIWVIGSQFVKLGQNLKACFFDISEEESITAGPFYEWWSQHIQISVNLTQEFAWNLHCKQQPWKTFAELPMEECVEGPSCTYALYGLQQNVSLTPLIKRIVTTDRILIGMRLESMPLEYSSLTIQCNLLCTTTVSADAAAPAADAEDAVEFRHSVCRVLTYEFEEQTKECVTCHIDEIKDLSVLQLQISLRMINMQ